MNYYFCDACRYCFSAEKLPDRCPDCGAQIYKEKPAVRLASKTEIEELLRIRKEDKEDIQNVQFVKDGDRLSGKASAESDFDALDDEDVLGGDVGEELPDYLR